MTLTRSQVTVKRFSKKEVALIGVGLLFCLMGLLATLVNLLAGRPEFQTSASEATLWGISMALIAWGIATIIFRRRDFIVNFNLALASLIIITPLVGEAFIRSAIGLKIDYFRDPGLYAGYFDADDYWNLRYRWQPETSPMKANFVVDPLLGWIPPKTADNPLGILAAMPYVPDFDEKTVLFYGDSFVYGSDPALIDERIPPLLDNLLPDYKVYNYGVPGYGVDQIHLRFRETHSAFQKPFIILGILTLDLDRSLFKVHTAPKPYFEIENDQLVLKGTPLPENSEEWFNAHPPSIKSYLLAILTQKYWLAASGFNVLELPNKVPQKKLINTKIIEAMAREAQAHDLPFLFVIFYAQQELKYEGWRERFLKDLLARLQIPYIDTKRLLLTESAEHAMDSSEFYYPENAHPNVMANCLVAQAIAAYFVDNKLETNIPVPDGNPVESASNLITIDAGIAGTITLDSQLKTPWPIERNDAEEACFDRSFLWLGHGEQQGLSGALRSGKTQAIKAIVEVEPGPARTDSHRTIALTLENDAGVMTEIRQFDQAIDLVFKGQLQAGLNKFSLKVLDEATVPQQPNGDTRPVLVLLHQIKVMGDSY